MKKFLIYFCFIYEFAISQCVQPVNFQLQKDIPMAFPTLQINLTARRDTAALKPFLYVCAKGSGLVIYNISTVTSPTLVATIGISSLQNLHVMNCTQSGNYLYLALGDHFSATAQKSGMAIVNISNPASPTVTSTYTYNATSGAGHVAIEGNYAYLSAMQNGVIVLDISNKSNIAFVSVFKPSVHFPKPNPNGSELLKINARQIVVKNNVLYLSYDAGGVRVIDATNKSSLKETGQYSNPAIINKARAYNNLILNDTLVYVAADYCGMEILNVKDTSNITQLGWWNPWKCETSSNNWVNSIGHTNEIEFDNNCNLVFMSAGRSDLFAVNVSNPSLPDSCSRFGIPTDSLGSWGIGRYKNQIYVSYLITGIPFYANWGGTKIITYNNNCTVGINELENDGKGALYPNPVSNELFIKSQWYIKQGSFHYKVMNAVGQICMTGIVDKSIDVSALPSGIYIIEINVKDNSFHQKFVKD